MLSLLLAASLNVLASTREAPRPAESQEEPAAPVEKPAKPVRRKLPSPAVPAEDPAGAPLPPKPRPRPRPAPRAVPVPESAPAVAVEPSAQDKRAARLEEENARLRRRLAPPPTVMPGKLNDPAVVLAELAAGNQRFVANARVRTLLSLQDAELREAQSKGETPIAVILTCSDSRINDNILFDQELGRLFTIQDAGNVVDPQALASVEFALDHLGSNLVIVLGHVGCSVVQAVSDAQAKPMPGNQWSLQAAMAGLLESTPFDPNEDPAAHRYHLVEHNAQRQAQALVDRSELVRDRVARKKLKVVPAVYDLATGKVTFLAM